jgi:hypothetical protein
VSKRQGGAGRNAAGSARIGVRGVRDIITTDVCLGFHPGTGSQPTDENIEHGFLLNSMFIDMLVKYDFAVVVVCIGLAASKKLYPALKSRRDIIVTCTYHAVLVSNDMRNGFTTNAARVSVAAAARLARLVVDYLLASEALCHLRWRRHVPRLLPLSSPPLICACFLPLADIASATRRRPIKLVENS